MTTGNKRIPKHDDPVSPSKKLFTESSPAIGHLTKTCSGRTYLTDIVESSLLSVQQTRAAGSHTTKPQTAPELQMRSKLGFLDLPYEIRRLIYIELFSTQLSSSFPRTRTRTPRPFFILLAASDLCKTCHQATSCFSRIVIVSTKASSFTISTVQSCMLTASQNGRSRWSRGFRNEHTRRSSASLRSVSVNDNVEI